MTIATATARVSYNGDGATTILPVPFVFFGATELRVVRRDIATGAETVLALGVDYTVTGGNGAIGAISMTLPPASGAQIFIIRNTARTQLVDYVPNDPFPAETHERALDRLTAITQEIGREIEQRAVLVPETETAVTLPASPLRAGQFLAFDAAGQPVPALPPGSATITPYMQTVLSASSATQARQTLIAASGENIANVRDFGAIGDGVADDTLAVQAAIDTGRQIIEFPEGTYRTTATLQYRQPCQVLRGIGPRSGNGARILVDAAVTVALNANSDTAGVTLLDCGLENILVSRSAYAAGTMLTVTRAHGFHLTDVTTLNFNRGVDNVSTRLMTYTRFTCSVRKPGGFCVRHTGTVADPAGVCAFYECRWDCIDNGEGPVGLGQEADGLVLSGAVPTVLFYGLQIVRPRRGLVMQQGSEGLGILQNPTFIYGFDYECDNTGEAAIFAETGTNIAIEAGWLQTGFSPYLTSPLRGAACYIGPEVKNFRFDGYQGGHAYHGFVIEGQDVQIKASVIGRNSAVRSGTAGPGYSAYVPTANNTYDNILIRSTAQRVQIDGGYVGRTENGTGLARHSVNIEAGAVDVQITGVDLRGSITSALNDPNRIARVVNCLGVDQLVLGQGTATPLEIGAQGQTMLRVGNTAALTVANRVRIAASSAGAAPSILAEGTDIDVGLLVATKGAGIGRLRWDASDALTWDSTRVDSRLPLRLQTYTVATLPSAVTHARSLIYVSDEVGGAVVAFSDGTNWRRVTDRNIVS